MSEKVKGFVVTLEHNDEELNDKINAYIEDDEWGWTCNKRLINIKKI